MSVLLTLEVSELLHCLEVPSGVRLTFPFNDAFYISKNFNLLNRRPSGHEAYFMNKSDLGLIPK